MTLTIELDLPKDLAQFRLPEAVANRLQDLLDRQDSGQPLTDVEREEAEGLADLAEFLTPGATGVPPVRVALAP